LAEISTDVAAPTCSPISNCMTIGKAASCFSLSEPGLKADATAVEFARCFLPQST
jgi:hypothetical protein